MTKAKRQAHECQQPSTCRCWLLADTPAENCPVHGWPDGRCDCGRFVARLTERERQAKEG
jgi:hypothetical protein